MIKLTMADCFTIETDQSVMLTPITTVALKDWLAQAPVEQQSWVARNNFKADADTACMLPDEDGQQARVLYGVKESNTVWTLAGAPGTLPPGDYKLDENVGEEQHQAMQLGWAIGSYTFLRYKKNDTKMLPRLVVDERDESVLSTMSAVYRVRDLINTPPDDMMPPQLSEQAKSLAEEYQAEFREIV